MKSVQIYIERAALIAALFFQPTEMAWSKGKGAQENSSSEIRTETYSDIIDKAYNLSLQKERSQAILILVNAIKKEAKKNPKAGKELIKTLEQVSSAFYSDKAQQLYELGISLRFSDQPLANQKIAEALKLEPDNLSIQLAQIRSQVMANDCGGAIAAAKKMREQNPYSEEIDLTMSQAAVCAGQFDLYQQSKQGFDEKSSPLARHWATVALEYHFRLGQFQKGIDMAKQREKEDPLFPETLYWRYKMEVEMKQLPEDAGSKYLNLCKAISARSVRAYLPEPSLCRRTTEVESFLKKNNNPNL